MRARLRLLQHFRRHATDMIANVDPALHNHVIYLQEAGVELMRHDRVSGCLVPSPSFLQVRDIALAMTTEQYEVGQFDHIWSS